MHELLHSVPPTLQQATTDPRLYLRLSDTHMQVRDSLLWVTAPFSLVLVHKVLLCPPRVYLPVLCKFWLLYSGVNGDLLQERLCHTQVCCTQSPSLWQFTADPYLHRRCSNTVLSQSLWGPWVLVHTRFCLCPPRVYFPVLCKFWQLCGGVNGGLLQEGLCHTQVCCTQSPCPRGSPLLTRTSTGDAQTQFCLSSCGVPGAWCAQGLFGPLSVVFILKAPQPTQAPDWLPVCDPAC